MIVGFSGTGEQKLGLQNQKPDRSSLIRVFQELREDSCPREYNFHMHTIFSDGQLKPEEAIEQAIAIGMKGLALTDHHAVGGYQVARRWLEEWRVGGAFPQGNRNAQHVPLLWSGIEINAGLLGSEVHVLGYAFDICHPAMMPYTQGKTPQGDSYAAERAIAAIHAAGGLAVLAHPVRYGRSPEELIPEAARLGIDGAEAYYAYGNPKPWQPSPSQTQRVLQLNKRYGLLSSCGTDTHGKNLQRRI